MISLEIAHETDGQKIERRLQEQRDGIAQELQELYAQKNRLLPIIARPDQLENTRSQQQRAIDAQATNPAPMTFEQLEAARREAHETGQAILAARPGAEKAKAQAQALAGEIAGLESGLAQAERAIFNHKTIALFRASIEPWVAAVKAQELIEQHFEEGRARGYSLPAIGVAVEPHPNPSASRTSRSDDVKAYLEFLLAGFDRQFEQSLAPNHPARRKLEAVARGAGIAAPGLVWH